MINEISRLNVKEIKSKFGLSLKKAPQCLIVRVLVDLTTGDVTQMALVSDITHSAEKKEQVYARGFLAVGTEYVYSEGALSTLAFLNMSDSSGNATLYVTPNNMYLPQELKSDHQNTFLRDWPLKSDYLPCPLGTEVGKIWRNGTGNALVNKATQEVLEIQFDAPSETASDPWSGAKEGQVLEETDTTIRITCVMANGGVCFGHAIAPKHLR